MATARRSSETALSRIVFRARAGDQPSTGATHRDSTSTSAADDNLPALTLGFQAHLNPSRGIPRRRRDVGG